jgi:hypothetical protein
MTLVCGPQVGPDPRGEQPELISFKEFFHGGKAPAGLT